MDYKEIGIKYEYIRIAWIIYSCISIVLAVLGIMLDWSGLTIFWIIMAELIVTFLVKYIDHVEQSLKAEADKAKRAERSKTDFLANMSHEIRTPMNAIVGMCELTLRENDISNRVRENCHNIQSSGRSLLSIINDILDFSKIDSGKMELIESEFNIASTLNDVINMAMTRKGNKDIEIIVDVAPDIPCGLYGDELRIRQVVINLITNAIKFTKEGSVTLKVSKTDQDYGVNLSISVIDTGIGITEENLEKLFTSFQQVDTRKNRSVEGTGLGLAISKRLVTRMGGFINVNSKYGKGSHFKITIPMRVTNPEPFITIEDAENQHIAGYIELNKYKNSNVKAGYKELMTDMGKKLGVDFRCYHEFSKFLGALERYGDSLTHVVTGREEYLACQDFFDDLSKRASVIVIQDKNNSIEPKGNVRCIFKPFYTLAAAACFNNEQIINYNDQARMGTRFVAPEAKVLIVDDNEINREVAAGLMKPYQMTVKTVDSGRAAIEAIKTKEYHLVFMDHMMPEMDGVEATQIIREMKDPYFKRLPIVALTANAVSGVREMFIKNGLSDFMAKPIELSILDRMLKNWLPDRLLQKPTAEQAKALEPVVMQKKSVEKSLVDHTKGIYYSGGDEEAYKGILATYVRSGKEKIKQISQLFNLRDWNNYIIEVHALKSTSMTIGAVELSELAKKLELAGKAKEYETIMSNQRELLNMYTKVVDECDSYLKSFEKPKNANGDSIIEGIEDEVSFKLELDEGMYVIYIREIAKACDLYDGEEITRLCQEVSMFSYKGKSLRPYFDKVKAYSDDFEFEKALNEVEDILDALDEM